MLLKELRYVFHAMTTGMKLWELDRYLKWIGSGCSPGQAYVRQLEWPSDL